MAGGDGPVDQPVDKPVDPNREQNIVTPMTQQAQEVIE